MKPHWILWLAIIGFAFTPDASADRININLTQFKATGTAADGNGALGGGTWNRINIGDRAGPNALVKSNGAASSATVSETAPAPGALSNLTPNAVMDAAWGEGVSLKVLGLLAGQVYKVAIYSDRVGTGVGNTDFFSVAGTGAEGKGLLMANVPGPALPGAENVDYLIFIATASADGELTIDGPWIAGVQIEGVLDANESGPQIDCRIKKQATGSNGKGNDVHSLNTSRTQSIRQKTIGRRAKRYYVNMENDGGEVDSCYAMAFFKKSQATIKVIARDGAGGNVTAEAIAQNFRYDLCKGEAQRFKIVVKPKSRNRATINVRICGSPSTLVTNKQDCATCVLQVVR